MTTRFTVTLTLQAPIMTKASGSIAFGFDAAIQTNAENKPLLPGSLIRGNIRHAWEELLDFIEDETTKKQIQQWLGDGSNDDKQTPNRSLLNFSNHWVDEKYKKTQNDKRYRIAIDENTGVVKTGALQIIQSPYHVGEKVDFIGYIDIDCTDAKQADLLQIWLQRAFKIIPALGSFKSNGFGKLLNCKITYKDSLIKTTGLKSSNEDVWGLCIKPNAPFCFAKTTLGNDNSFEAKNYIPAGAIIASIASYINNDEYKELKDNINNLHFTHASPVKENEKKRPIALPLSVVKSYKGVFANIANQPNIQTIGDCAPSFLIDWKYADFDALNKKYQQDINLTTQLTIRTAIDKSTGTAKESQLFSLETISPDNHEWLANVNFSQVPEGCKEEVKQQLAKVFSQPLKQLGKTKAQANVKISEAFSYTQKSADIEGEKVVIYLQTPARLLPTGFCTYGTNDGDKLKQAYQDSWRTLSDTSLTLDYFFAQQHLQGGNHWWQRFRKSDASKSNVKNSYHPEIFTSSGSVFILTINDTKVAKAKLQQWLSLGLPQIDNDSGGEEWDKNPWIAQNGFGEIAINFELG